MKTNTKLPLLLVLTLALPASAAGTAMVPVNAPDAAPPAKTAGTAPLVKSAGTVPTPASAPATAPAPLSDRDVEYVRQLITKGNACMVHKQFPQAISDYEEALTVDPANTIARLNLAETYNNWGIVLYSQRKFTEAIGQWQHCLKVNPKHAKARRNINIAQQAAAAQGNLMDDESHHSQGFEEETVTPPPKGFSNQLKSDPQSKANSSPDTTGFSDGAGDAASPPPDKKPAEKAAAPIEDSFSGGAKSEEPKSTGKEQAAVEAPPADSGQYGSALINLPSRGSQPYDRFASHSSGAPADAVPGAGAQLPTLNAVAPVIPVAPATAVAPVGAGGNMPPAGTMLPTTPAAPAAPALPAGTPAYRYHPVNATYPVLPDQFSGQVPASPVPGQLIPTQYGMGIAPNAVLPAESPRTIFGAPAANGGGAAPTGQASLDDQLSAMEVKVYGHKQTDMTVLQRLEKMEMDATKQTQSGTIVDRINLLRHNFGF